LEPLIEKCKKRKRADRIRSKDQMEFRRIEKVKIMIDGGELRRKGKYIIGDYYLFMLIIFVYNMFHYNVLALA